MTAASDTKVRRPKRYSEAELRRVGVQILSMDNVTLRCAKCQQHFSPNLAPGGRLPRNYWVCPNGCNRSARGGEA